MNQMMTAPCRTTDANSTDPDARFSHGTLSGTYDESPTNISRTTSLLKLAADQGDARAQFYYGAMLWKGEGIGRNKPLAAHYYKLAADQGLAQAQCYYGICLLRGDCCKKNPRIAVGYIERAADGGFLPAQILHAMILKQGFACKKNAAQAAHDRKVSADQGHLHAPETHVDRLHHGVGVKIESQTYFRAACRQEDSSVKLRAGIVLLSGILGRFEFKEARTLFAEASSSNRTAQILESALSGLDDHLITSNEYLKLGNVFSLIRSPSHDNISIIRLMTTYGDDRVTIDIWREMALSSVNFLLDLSQRDSVALRSLPTELPLCQSIKEMIAIIFKMYSTECSLYKNVNHLLRYFPVRILSKFMKELGGMLRYVYLLQSSIHYCSHIQHFSSNFWVYRAVPTGGSELVNLYHSMIGEIIVWPGFTSTSTDYR
jgi:hypothetical protein